MITNSYLMRTQKHKNLSFDVLNMAKFTIVSLIFIDFEPIFSYSICFEEFLGGSICFKKKPSSKNS